MPQHGRTFRKGGTRLICKFYGTTDGCRYGASCRFSHRDGAETAAMSSGGGSAADKCRTRKQLRHPGHHLVVGGGGTRGHDSMKRRRIRDEQNRTAILNSRAATSARCVPYGTFDEAQNPPVENSPEGPLGQIPGMYWDAAKKKYFRKIAGQPLPNASSNVTARPTHCIAPCGSRQGIDVRSCVAVPVAEVFRRRHSHGIHPFRSIVWHALLQHRHARRARAAPGQPSRSGYDVAIQRCAPPTRLVAVDADARGRHVLVADQAGIRTFDVTTCMPSLHQHCTRPSRRPQIALQRVEGPRSILVPTVGTRTLSSMQCADRDDAEAGWGHRDGEYTVAMSYMGDDAHSGSYQVCRPPAHQGPVSQVFWTEKATCWAADYSLRHGTVACACDHGVLQLSRVGTSHSRNVRAAEGGTRMLSSDLLAVRWAQSGSTLGAYVALSGSRSGHTFGFDIRKLPPSTRAYPDVRLDAPTTMPVHHIEGVAVGGGGAGLVVGYMTGALLLWDVRHTKHPVLQYDGHVSGVAKQPLSIDHAAGLLCAGGSDGVVRVWDVNIGGSPVAAIDLTQPPVGPDTPLTEQRVTVALVRRQWGNTRVGGVLAAHTTGPLRFFPFHN
eukprot:m.66587 g.66587  ORF g.66587 m.66587 type:complete len:609 (+) comp15955_c0_seq4:372-2198(+)